MDDRRAEVRGQRQPSNDPCSEQHSPGTPTTGLRERGNDTSRSTGRSGRQNAATRRNTRREDRVTAQGPVKTQQRDGLSHRGGGGVPPIAVFPKSPGSRITRPVPVKGNQGTQSASGHSTRAAALDDPMTPPHTSQQLTGRQYRALVSLPWAAAPVQYLSDARSPCGLKAVSRACSSRTSPTPPPPFRSPERCDSVRLNVFQ